MRRQALPETLGRLLWALVVVLLLAAPYAVGPLELGLILDILVLAVAVMSCNLLTGVTGQISLAQGAFLGIGGYVTAMLVGNQGWSYWASLPAAVLGAALVGTLIGLPALRITGLHLALVTLGLAIVFPTVILRIGDPAGGPNGLSLDDRLSVPTWFWSTPLVWDYWVLTLTFLVAMLIARNVVKSRVGRALLTIRDQPILAAATGTNVRLAKVGAFAFASALAGLGGWMFTTHHQFVSPTDFGVMLSLNILLAMTLGGAGTIIGPLVGATFLRYSTDISQAVGVNPLLTPALTGLAVIVILYSFPRGAAGTVLELVRSRAGRPDASPADATAVLPSRDPLAPQHPHDSRVTARSNAETKEIP